MKDVYCDVLSRLESLVQTRTVVQGLDVSVEFSFRIYSLSRSVLMARMIIGNRIRNVTIPTADGVAFGKIVVHPVGERVGVPVVGKSMVQWVGKSVVQWVVQWVGKTVIQWMVQWVGKTEGQCRFDGNDSWRSWDND